jgi:plastocyanin
MVNGCTLATAKDMTGMKSVTITDIAKWTFGHQACVLLTGGTQVVWDGDFNTHPLTGGESGKADLASPISMAMVNGTTATALIPVEQGKAYPYFCSKHPSMQGVIYTK